MKKRNRTAGRPGCACGCISAACLISLLILVNLHTPEFDIPTPKMPNPNARDFILKATALAMNGAPPALGAPVIPVQRQLANSDAPARSLLKQSFAYSYLEPPLRSFNTLLPHFSRIRNLARSVAYDSDAFAAGGQWDTAADTAIDDVQMGGMIPHGSTLIGGLVGMACQAIGRRPLWTDVDHVSAREARETVKRLAEIERSAVPFADTMREEKWAMLAGLREVFRKRNWAHFVADSMGARSSATVDIYTFLYVTAVGKGRILHNVADYMDRQAALDALPYAPGRKIPEPPSDPISQVLYPVYNQAQFKSLESTAENRLLMTAFALRAYRLEQGRYPAALGDLVSGGYLKAVPQDPFGPGRPFSYHVQGVKYVLYSVGPDGKDDGGKAIFDKSRAQGSANKRAPYQLFDDSKGDIVAGLNQ